MNHNSASKEKFNAKEFMQCLLEEGTKRFCDETVSSFKDSNLPDFYDEDMFKRGQKFFNDNIFALLYGKFLGLLSVLAIPSVVRMLMFTNKSSSSLAAYRRYLSTLFHMCIWYQDDFTPDSKLWKSLLEVKKKHNFASNSCFKVGLGRISQKDMAVTQFGFIGYSIIRRQEIGLYNVNDEDLKAFVHVWRVIGYLLGLENRYNICRESLEETAQICNLLAEELLKPVIEKKDKDFITMATYLSDGMWSMNPTFNAKVYLNIVYKLLQKNSDTVQNSEYLIELSFFQHLLLQFIYLVVWSSQFIVLKYIYNYTQFFALWLMKVFPFLAFYQFGSTNSYVRMLQDEKPIIKL